MRRWEVGGSRGSGESGNGRHALTQAVSEEMVSDFWNGFVVFGAALVFGVVFGVLYVKARYNAALDFKKEK